MKPSVTHVLHNTSTSADNGVQLCTQKLLTIKEVVAYLNVSRSYFYEHLIDEVPAVFLDDEKKVRRYDITAVNRWIRGKSD